MTDTIADPFAQTADTEDPFATADDVKGSGGTFRPSPKPEDLEGRLIAMIPRSFRNDAPKLDRFVKPGESAVQDQYTVDLYVIDRAPLTYWYNAKVEGSEERKLTEYVIPAEDMPAGFEGVWIQQAALIGQLRKVDGSAKPIVMGRMRKGPQARDRGKQTFETIAAETQAWRDRGSRGEAPRFSWQVDVMNEGTPDHAEALAWWRSAGITL